VETEQGLPAALTPRYSVVYTVSLSIRSATCCTSPVRSAIRCVEYRPRQVRVESVHVVRGLLGFGSCVLCSIVGCIGRTCMCKNAYFLEMSRAAMNLNY
jgi:hypothetical protein